MSSIKQQMNFLIRCHRIIRITSHSKTLKDNIFSIYISQNIVSGNLTATISDHISHFLIALHIFWNVPNTKNNIFQCDWSKFNREEFILDYFSVDWPQFFQHFCNISYIFGKRLNLCWFLFYAYLYLKMSLPLKI